MNFKVVIWGLGTNGHNLIDILGEKHIVAIIESDPYKLEMKYYKNIPIICFEQYLEEYMNTYIIVTPLHYKGIEQQLKNSNVKHYFIQAKCQARYLLIRSVIKESFIEEFEIDVNKHYILLGANLFSICLYNYMRKNNVSIEIRGNNETEKMHISNLCDMTGKMKDNAVHIYICDEEDAIKRENYLSYQQLNDFAYKKIEENIKQLKNCHKGERIFIIGNGPSLRYEDLELLQQQNEITMGVNGIFYILDKVTWRPSYYVAMDYEVIKIYEEYCLPRNFLTESIKIFSDNCLIFQENNYQEGYYYFKQEQLLNEIKFSSNCEKGVYTAGTVIYSCLQLAIYMGFEEIYLLGCDFSYSNNKEVNYHCYKEGYSIYKKELITEQKLKFTNADLMVFPYEKAKKGNEKAKEYAKKNGIKIKNATRGGKLEVFERVNFDDIFK